MNAHDTAFDKIKRVMSSLKLLLHQLVFITYIYQINLNPTQNIICIKTYEYNNTKSCEKKKSTQKACV